MSEIFDPAIHKLIAICPDTRHHLHISLADALAAQAHQPLPPPLTAPAHPDHAVLQRLEDAEAEIARLRFMLEERQDTPLPAPVARPSAPAGSMKELLSRVSIFDGEDPLEPITDYVPLTPQTLEPRDHAQWRVREAARVATRPGDQIRYELAMQAHNQSAYAVELLSDEAHELGMPVGDLVAQIIGDRRDAERRSSWVAATVARTIAAIASAPAAAVTRIADTAIRDIRENNDGTYHSAGAAAPSPVGAA
jgi:hypothetical protein